MRSLRAVARLLRLLAHILAGLATVLLRFPRMAPEAQHARVQAWSRELLAHAGIALEIRGTPPAAGPVLLVANHLSWLDISVMHAARHCRFISKSDVERWPVIGRLATAAGTLYIERSTRRDAMRIVRLMQEALARREVLGVFPEGTTADGTELLPFHANLLQAAVLADAPVQPVGLRFVDRATSRPSADALYVGDDTLLASLWRVLRAEPMVAVVHYGQPERAAGRDRRVWAEDLRHAVDALRKG
jgi:1-acyl-sn-glycerol-3-phosphate acyltransferase